MAKLKVLSDFNIEVEVDLLFWSTRAVLHLVDACIRWSAAIIIASRVAQDILNGIAHVWLRLYGPMKRLTSDEEGALDSAVASAWADRWGMQLNLRPRGSHARVVERHNALLRDAVHKINPQVERDGIAVTPQAILDEATLANNSMISIHGTTPYKALYGRSPALLRDFEPGSETPLSDGQDGIDGVSRHVHRLPEVAMSSVIQGTATDRLNRAMNSRTRPAGELLELKIGDEVDIYRDPPNKDLSGPL
eukprot:3230224-Pyramimonas_sp.AAC.1